MLTKSSLHERIDFQVAASAIGPHGRLTLPNLIRMFQEAAMRNTVRLNISGPQLIASHGVSWVLRRQSISCDRWPELGEMLQVVTAPTGFERDLLTYRDFHLLDQNGHTIITATTEWLLMDVKSRRLRPIPPHIAALKDDLAPAAAHLKRPDGKIVPPSRHAFVRDSSIAFYQLDFNTHLTNPVFPELMIEPLGLDFLTHHLPAEIDISFQKEAMYGEEVRAVAAKEETGTLSYRHALQRGEEVLATMVSDWQPLL